MSKRRAERRATKGAPAQAGWGDASRLREHKVKHGGSGVGYVGAGQTVSDSPPYVAALPHEVAERPSPSRRPRAPTFA
jgi:hypothetical protein